MIVVDTSAVIAVLYGEPGSETAINRLAGGVVSTINYAESGAKLLLSGWQEKEWRQAFDDMGLSLRPFDRQSAILSASLATKLYRRGISFADRACLALAMIEGLPVLTGDRKWAELGLDVKVELFR